MKLLIISDAAHCQSKGAVYGWGSLVTEIDHLSRIFTSIVHIAPLHHGMPAQTDLPYKAENVKMHFVKPAGGNTLLKKIQLLLSIPKYALSILQEAKTADVVHVRCPSNVCFVGLLLLIFMKYPKKRWFKYAGNWKPKKDEPLTFKFQRWLLLSGLHRGIVTINGKWKNQARHIVSFYNPCFDESELIMAHKTAEHKVLQEPLSLIFVGGLEIKKGIWQLLEIIESLINEGINFRLDVLGDGTFRYQMEQRVKELNAQHRVYFHGWISRGELNRYYEKAHFILHPSISEGWPKVISEAMAYGVVPLASGVSCIPQMLAEFKTGKVFDHKDIKAQVLACSDYLKAPSSWQKESSYGVQAAGRFTYECYLRNVSKKILGINHVASC